MNNDGLAAIACKGLLSGAIQATHDAHFENINLTKTRWNMKSDIVQFPDLTIEEKWNTAESNLVYFIVCGIAFAKTMGKTAEDFGTFSGNVANWENSKKREPKVLIEGIYRNKSQFKDFEMEIVQESEDVIEAKMRGFGENLVRNRRKQDITVEEYLGFFGKKWEAIAKQLELIYKQHLQGQWLQISVAKR